MKKSTVKILDLMEQQYGNDIKCYLNYEQDWQLLIATILSAQCTDARVNEVTKDLFCKYSSIEAFANANLTELEKDIYSTGFYRNKAKNIIACCQKLLGEYQCVLPHDIDSLTHLPGVGRKTANVVRGNIFHEPSIVVDTHVLRVSGKLGLSGSKDPYKTELQLMKEIPKEYWIRVNLWFIAFGRSVCTAPTPKCEACYLREYCKETKQKRAKKKIENN